jgi:hypothetical protein
VGDVRRSQLITTYGVGSLIAIDDQSFIVCGIDDWNVSEEFQVSELRLESQLNVAGFHLPPTAADPPNGRGVAVRRFPDWYQCACDSENLKPYGQLTGGRTHDRCTRCNERPIPSRFIVACANGHLNDFPYWTWVHKGSSPTADERTHELTIASGGHSASLRNIIISCTCKKTASMEGVFNRQTIRKLRIACNGGRPWLGRDQSHNGCSESPRVMQRGSSAAWYPVIKSSLAIPPYSSNLYREVKRAFKGLRHLRSEDLANAAKDFGCTADELSQTIREIQRYKEISNEEEQSYGLEASGPLRLEEYRTLSVPAIDDGRDFECRKPEHDPYFTEPTGIDSVMQVMRMREVRALQSFTRVDPPLQNDPPSRRAHISRRRPDWLPAVEVRGEGVFLKLDTDKVSRWENAEGQRRRADHIRQNHERAMRSRHGDAAAKSPIDARFILLHSLAHSLIEEWSLECGYPSGSLRERLYFSHDEVMPMAGILIYTATSDSAGSLGGLVEQAEAKWFAESVAGAIQRQRWCSADPLCMETQPHGTDGLNFAACHSCLLIAETSCEYYNGFLDRAMLVGFDEDKVEGFFE